MTETQTVPGTLGAAPTIDAQRHSMFFRLLPQELRNMIYDYHFSSTRLAHGWTCIGPSFGDIVKIKPAPNALALLRSCRRAKAEIGHSWMNQVLFSFEDAEEMLDRLTTLTPAVLSTVRHVRVRGGNLMLRYQGNRFVLYRLPSLLKLLPGLRLETLTVFGCDATCTSYETLDDLIQESSGWKELRYVHHSALLAFPESRPFRRRKPQPWHWQRVLEDRDGSLSKPSVVIYRAVRPAVSVLQVDNRELLEQAPPQTRAEEQSFGIQEEPTLLDDAEIGTEVMIVAKRGKGIDYEEKSDSPFLGKDIRREMPGKTWQEIRAACIDRFLPSRNGKSLFDNLEEEDQAVEYDEYEDVDEL
ncbi:hypothetical protein VTK56DRAFT_3018 [Thermocarpiscus australiensis]